MFIGLNLFRFKIIKKLMFSPQEKIYLTDLAGKMKNVIIILINHLMNIRLSFIDNNNNNKILI
jgi:hypothetical protein